MTEKIKGPEKTGIPPELREIFKEGEKQLVLEQIGKDPHYFMQLAETNKDSLKKEVDRLEKATCHYRQATGEELD